MDSCSRARWMIEALEGLHWNWKEAQRQCELIKCFLKKGQKRALRIDLKGEDWRQEDWLFTAWLWKIPLSLQMYKSTLLHYLGPLLVSDSLCNGNFKRTLSYDEIWWLSSFLPFWKDSGHISYPNATFINFFSSIQLLLAFMMFIFKMYVCDLVLFP